jgi:hypothetical protein
VTNRVYGIRAQNFSPSVTWTIDGLVTEGVDEDVSTAGVPNPPA